MKYRFVSKKWHIIFILILFQFVVLGGIFVSIGAFQAAGGRAVTMGPSGSEAQETEEKSIDTTDNPSLSIDNPVGSVIVKAWNKPQVRVEAVKRTYAETDDSAQATLENLQVNLADQNGTIIVSTVLPHPPAGAFSFPSGRYIVEYFISAPTNAEIVDLHVIRGSADISGIAGQINQITASGPVRIEDCQGDIAVNSTRGAIYVVRPKGKLVLRANGEVQVNDADGVTIDSTNSRGSFSFTGSLGPGADNHIQTQGGSSLVLPPDSGLNLDLEAQKGDIKIDFPVAGPDQPPTSDSASGQVFKGVIGKPGAFLQVRSSSGGIQIKEKK